MAYDLELAGILRQHLSNMAPSQRVEEKKMFKGVSFLVDGKMCMGISGNQLMVRFDPALQMEVEHKAGFSPMWMKERKYKGYGYIDQNSLLSEPDWRYWIGLCLDFNPRAKASKSKKQA